MKDAIQEQLVTARKNQILEAATRVFAQKGFHPTTIKDIAKEAGIAEGTIYIYFKNKTDLLVGILERMREAVVGQEEVAPLISADTDLRTFIKAYVSYPLMALKADNFELFRIIISEIMVNPQLRELYYQRIFEPTIVTGEKLFEKWGQTQLIRPLDAHLTMRAISSMILGLILQFIMGDKTLETDWDVLPDFLADLILNGLANNKGVDYEQ